MIRKAESTVVFHISKSQIVPAYFYSFLNASAWVWNQDKLFASSDRVMKYKMAKSLNSYIFFDLYVQNNFA